MTKRNWEYRRNEGCKSANLKTESILDYTGGPNVVTGVFKIRQDQSQSRRCADGGRHGSCTTWEWPNLPSPALKTEEEVSTRESGQAPAAGQGGKWTLSPRASWWLSSQESACNVGDTGDGGSTPGSGWPPGRGMAAHSSILAWTIPLAEEAGVLRSLGLQRVRRDWECTLC